MKKNLVRFLYLLFIGKLCFSQLYDATILSYEQEKNVPPVKIILLPDVHIESKSNAAQRKLILEACKNTKNLYVIVEDTTSALFDYDINLVPEYLRLLVTTYQNFMFSNFKTKPLEEQKKSLVLGLPNDLLSGFYYACKKNNIPVINIETRIISTAIFDALDEKNKLTDDLVKNDNFFKFYQARHHELSKTFEKQEGKAWQYFNESISKNFPQYPTKKNYKELNNNQNKTIAMLWGLENSYLDALILKNIQNLIEQQKNNTQLTIVVLAGKSHIKSIEPFLLSHLFKIKEKISAASYSDQQFIAKIFSYV